ncbi:AraC family transcriptional regulator [Pelagicoccus sp. SDUM812003]|uniref:AraC family transcriptional regulator n=1 Tax=Pelagicoccus sp. SDUM812003 TaxID=3041267 RepID=UPI00280FBFD1|nr:AraC family transcriptional regulator [Pelagicoccus sp. SDUM812003]MDQ8203325.1 AraC family transcriptional regulator [Pelagicoccus sp. SDUM812003]
MLATGADQGGDEASVVFQEFDGKQLSDPLHRHDHFELLFIWQGKGRWQLGAKTGAFERGSLLLCPPGILHAYHGARADGEPGAVGGIALRFSRKVLPQGLLALPEMSALCRLVEAAEQPLVFVVSDRDRLRARLRSIHRAKSALRLARFYVALELVAEFECRQVVEAEGVAKEMTPRDRARFDTARRFVEGRFAEGIGRDEAALAVGLEPEAFSRFFRCVSGTTFVDYLANLRVRHAATLLGSRRGLSLREVAERSGFRNLSTFHRQFKRKLGTTPSAYRKAANTENQAP